MGTSGPLRWSVATRLARTAAHAPASAARGPIFAGRLRGAQYSVDERSHTFTFHVEGALVRTFVGKDLPRFYEFSGRQTHCEVHPRG